MPPSAISRDVERLGPWFHNLHLPDGTQTAPDHFLGDFPRCKWRQIEPFMQRDMHGLRVLDIGCNAGYYSFELVARGARVTAIDADERYLAQARWAARLYGVDDQVVFRHASVYQLADDKEQYDLVLFMGVFYHLRYPLLALDIVRRRARRGLVFQTLTMPGEKVVQAQGDYALDQREVMNDAGWPKMAFIEHCLVGDPTNWWAPNHAGVEALLRSAGFSGIRRIGHEIYLAEVGDGPWPAVGDELDSVLSMRSFAIREKQQREAQPGKDIGG